MKKFISLLGVFFLSTAGYAANKIEMVTYFPVPYVAYSRVQVDKILDIGLTNVCNMSLGCTESGNAGLRPLHVQDAYLETGSLDLTRALAVRSNNVSLGANAGEANIDFNDSLRIKNLNDGYSLETSQLTVDALKLFPNRIVNNFPSCAATGADGAPQVSWQKLKIKDKEETFLVCGNVSEAEACTGNPPEKERSCGCPGGVEKAIYDCVDGKWEQTGWGECSNPVGDTVSCSWTPLGGYYTVHDFTSSRWEAVLLHIYSQLPSFENVVPSSDPTGGADYDRNFNVQSSSGTTNLKIYLSRSNDISWKSSLLSSIENQTNSWATGPDNAPVYYVIYSANSGRVVALDLAVCKYCP